MKGLSEGEQLARIFLVLVLYCWASLPLMYLCSFLFSIPSGGFTKMIMANIITGKRPLLCQDVYYVQASANKVIDSAAVKFHLQHIREKK